MAAASDPAPTGSPADAGAAGAYSSQPTAGYYASQQPAGADPSAPTSMPSYQSYGSGAPNFGNQVSPQKSPVDWVKTVFQKYATFDGRAPRPEYWWFVLFNFIVFVVFDILARASKVFAFVELIYALAVIVPGIAVTCRRLHDTNRSGWLQLIQIIPVVGFIILLVFTCQDSNPGPNKYGPNPKTVA